VNDEPQQPPQGGPPPGADPEQLSAEQQEMLRRMEEEMRTVRVQDVVTQSVVSILNLAARRIAKEDERDLEQAKLGIDAVRALVDLLEPEPQREVRNALSQIQVMYAQHSGGDAGEEGGGGGEGPPRGGPEGAGGAGGDRPSSRLWTPGS
jgi:hypothetical protein